MGVNSIEVAVRQCGDQHPSTGYCNQPIGNSELCSTDSPPSLVDGVSALTPTECDRIKVTSARASFRPHAQATRSPQGQGLRALLATHTDLKIPSAWLSGQPVTLHGNKTANTQVLL